MFALEDIIGGHSAAANFLVKVLAFVAQNPHIQKNIQSEVDNLLNERAEKSVQIGDRHKLIYTEATIMESLRMISSPIVPHVASRDSTIDGEYKKKKKKKKNSFSSFFDLWRDVFNGFLMEFFLSSRRLFSKSRHINFP